MANPLLDKLSYNGFNLGISTEPNTVSAMSVPWAVIDVKGDFPNIPNAHDLAAHLQTNYGDSQGWTLHWIEDDNGIRLWSKSDT